jgi:hypothetical protein
MTQTMSMKVDAKKNCESIHSGQFMVSHIEQEEPDEYQDPDYTADEDDDCEEINDATKSKLIPGPSSGICTQLERYKPQADEATSKHYEIDTDLSQVFNTLNVTYK